MTMKAPVSIAGLAALGLLLLLAACSGDDEETDGAGGGGGSEPDAAVVEVLQSLPVVPKAAPSSLANGKYSYAPGASETGRDLWTGFDVSAGTTVEDVTSFFGKEMPARGWTEEGDPWTQEGEKEGSVSKTVVYTFAKDELRLHIQISLTPPRDATPPPGGVSHVNLILAPKDIQLYGSPVGTRIDSTPAPTPKQVTPTYTAGPVRSYAPTPVTPTP